MGACWAATPCLAAPITTPPTNCASVASPYAYTQGAASKCFVTDPLVSVTPLPDGGMEYVYRQASGDLVSEPVPPAGENLASLSAAQLDEYGLPPRPTSAVALVDWDQAMSGEQFETPPAFLAEVPPAQLESPPAPANPASPAASCSGNVCTLYGTFAGWETSYYIGQPHTVMAHGSDEYKEPHLYGTSCPTPGLSTWTGIGNTGTIFGQDGTDSFSGGVQHTEFWETWDASGGSFHGTGYLSTVPVGDTVRANVNYSNGTVSGTVTNVTTGKVRGWSDSGLTGAAPDTADGIAEKVGGYDLANFGNSPGLTFLDSTGNGVALNNQPPWDGHPAPLNQFDIQSGSSVANSSTITGNGSFTIQQEHC